MPDFNVRSDSVNVEQIMEQIRARIREKRGVDYTEAQIRELAAAKLETFLDPRGIRSDLVDQFRRAKPAYEPPEPEKFSFEDATLFESHRASVRWIRKLLQPVLKLFFNPNPLIQALHIQSHLNQMYAEREATREPARRQMDQLYYELIHNLVIEATRLGIDVKNLKMRVESLTSRLEFNERRARALESVVAYEPGEEPVEPPHTPVEASGTAVPQSPSVPPPGTPPDGPGQRSRRRRRRRGRRGGGGSAASGMGPSTVRESQGRSEDAQGTTGPGQTPSRLDPPPPPSNGIGSTAECPPAPEAQPNEPPVEGSTGHEPDSQ